jgi:phosphomannomutase
LAVPVSCNTAIEKSNSFEKVVRTRIGSPYVIAAFEALAAEFKRLAGFEANGGFILGSDVELNGQVLKALPTRDALLPGIVLIAGAASAGKLLSELVASLPARYTASDRIKDVPTQWSRELLNAGAEQPEVLLSKIGFTETIEAVDTTDGLRLTLASGDIVHLRPSGNAPELRCYAESGDQDVAEAIVVKALKGVQTLA